MQREDISFDESDKNLFQVDDARLRADALKHSILPRLHIVMNECISTIRRVYGIEVLDDSIVSFYPHFRQKRDNELDLLYEAAYVGLGGKRVKGKWFGVERKDKKPVQIVPFRLGILLTQDGLGMLLENQWLKGLTDISFEKYLGFHLEYESLVHRLCYLCGMQPFLSYGEGLKPISTFRQHYHYMMENRIFDNNFMSQNWRDYPITFEVLGLLTKNYVLFFPIYDSYIRISKGESVRFLELIENANNWLIAMNEDNKPHKVHNLPSQEAVLQANRAAEQRVKVMPAIRWQVFQRDNWKCVSCGKGSTNGVILHVDHVIPRSKGGKDTLENYQTLCNLCNLGKSNTDDTNLRLKN